MQYCAKVLSLSSFVYSLLEYGKWVQQFDETSAYIHGKQSSYNCNESESQYVMTVSVLHHSQNSLRQLSSNFFSLQG